MVKVRQGFRLRNRKITQTNNCLLITTQSSTLSPSSALPEKKVNRAGDQRGMSLDGLKAVKETYTGYLTASAAKRLQERTEIFFNYCESKVGINPVTGKLAKFMGSFITLTIPDPIEFPEDYDQYKRCLKPFIEWMHRKYNGLRYVWRGESQSRGTPHYHIFSNRFVDLDEAKHKWYEIIKREGFTKQWDAENDKFPEACFNVKGIHADAKLRSYLNGYLYKKDQGTKRFKGRVWGCDKLTAKCGKLRLPVTAQFEKNVEAAVQSGKVIRSYVVIDREKVTRTIKELNERKEEEFVVCTQIRCIRIRPRDLYCPEQLKVHNDYVAALRRGDWEYTLKLPWEKDDELRQYQEYIAAAPERERQSLIAARDRQLHERLSMLEKKRSELAARARKVEEDRKRQLGLYENE